LKLSHSNRDRPHEPNTERSTRTRNRNTQTKQPTEDYRNRIGTATIIMTSTTTTTVKEESKYYGGKYHGRPTLEYRQRLPETADLTWEDDYFDREQQVLVSGHDVIAVFDYDYDAIEDFETKRATMNMLISGALIAVYGGLMGALLFGPIGAILCAVLLPCGIYVPSGCCCLFRQQVRWRVRAQHLAVTEDGIRLVSEQHRGRWGRPAFDVAKTSRMVAMEQIIDCDVYEPAGSECWCGGVPRTLVTVSLATTAPVAGGIIVAGGGAAGQQYNNNPNLFQLRVDGLKEPYQFHQLIWALKKRAKQAGSASAGTYLAPAEARIIADLEAPSAQHNNKTSIEIV
jgi:hypothetical protein